MTILLPRSMPGKLYWNWDSKWTSETLPVVTWVSAPDFRTISLGITSSVAGNTKGSPRRLLLTAPGKISATATSTVLEDGGSSSGGAIKSLAIVVPPSLIGSWSLAWLRLAITWLHVIKQSAVPILTRQPKVPASKLPFCSLIPSLWMNTPQGTGPTPLVPEDMGRGIPISTTSVGNPLISGLTRASRVTRDLGTFFRTNTLIARSPVGLPPVCFKPTARPIRLFRPCIRLLGRGVASMASYPPSSFLSSAWASQCPSPGMRRPAALRPWIRTSLGRLADLAALDFRAPALPAFLTGSSPGSDFFRAMTHLGVLSCGRGILRCRRHRRVSRSSTDCRRRRVARWGSDRRVGLFGSALAIWNTGERGLSSATAFRDQVVLEHIPGRWV